MKYRAEVDGLRALAVLPVVLFHAGVPAFSGGFVGVDVFFVISGYLITSILLEDARQDRISLAVFYERRARRILPVLFCVMLCTLVASAVWLPASSFAELASSELAVLAFVSNIYFYLQTNYFATAAEEKPMLHTWSLAVEEQFYVFFPLLLALMLRLHLRSTQRMAVLAAIAVLSLGAAHLMSWRHGAANFFLIPTRAWELIAGAMLALVPTVKRVGARPMDGAGAMAGLCLLVYANLAFDRHTPFPGLPTLVPVLATVLLIRYAVPGTSVGVLLSLRPLVAIGLISYSMYLWHQPLLALLRAKSLGTPDAATVAAVLLACTALAAASYRWVERPFRDRQRFSARQIARISVAGAAAIAIACGAILAGGGLPGRFSVPDYSATMQVSPMRARCHTEGVKYLPPAKACRTLDDEPTWAVLGDSHTVELAEALGRQLAPRGESVLRLSFSGCPPAWGYEARQPGCSAWTREAVEHLAAQPTIRTVVVGYRHAAYLFGDQLASYPAVPDDAPTHLADRKIAERSPTKAREQYWAAFVGLLERLRSAGKTVVVVYPVPELPADIHKALSQVSVFEPRPLLGGEQTTPRSYFEARQRFVLDRLNRLPWGEGLRRVRPDEIFCGKAHCRAVLESRALYFDDDHMSLAGADYVAKRIVDGR